MAGVAWALPANPANKKKAQSVEAVRVYLESKLERHDSKLPKYDELMALYAAGGWKYGGAFPDGGRVGYRITIRQAARVIHVHMNGTLIDRAHFIRKLVENEAKTKGKLTAMEGGNLTAGQQAQFGEKYAQTRMQENAPTLGAELRARYDAEAAEDRHESIIFNANAPAIHRFKYNGGAGALGKEILRAIRDTINARAGDGTVTGATGLTL
jgi:hypothetical protein